MHEYGDDDDDDDNDLAAFILLREFFILSILARFRIASSAISFITLWSFAVKEGPLGGLGGFEAFLDFLTLTISLRFPPERSKLWLLVFSIILEYN